MSKLHSIEVTVRTARDYVPVRYIHHPQNQMTYSLLWRVEANAFVARANLLRTFDIAAGINDMRGRNLRVFELDAVTDILAEMYQILEELGSLLYSRNGNDLRSVASDFSTKLESAVSTASHCIMILESACSQKIARDLSEEAAERLYVEASNQDEGFGEDPAIKQADEEKAARERLQRECISSSLVFATRRAAYVLACCMALSASQQSSDSDIETESKISEIRIVIEALLTVSLLLGWHVPTQFRARAARAVANMSHALKVRLSHILPRSPAHSGGAVFKSLMVNACDTLLNAARTYEAHADGKPISKFPWNIRKPFESHFVIFNLAEAMFLTHHMLHMLEFNLQKSLEKTRATEEAYGVLDACTLMMRTVTIAHEKAVDCVKKVESDFDSAISMLCDLGGEGFLEKFLSISRSDAENSTQSDQDIAKHMFAIAQHVRSACYGLQDLNEYVRLLRVHGEDRSRIAQYMQNVYLSCTRVFDSLVHEGYHNYAWNVSCKSTLPVLPGELPGKVDKCVLLHGDNAPSMFFSSEVLEEVFSLAILEKLSTCRDLEKQSTGYLSSIYEVALNIKDWLLGTQAQPSSQLSVDSTTRLLHTAQEHALRTPIVGTVVTNVCCGRVHEMECRSYSFVNYRGL
ncbi:hypothetical protein R4I06_04020 [Anaplasma bovis]